MKKAIAYIRFSSEGQKDGSSIERQTETIDPYIERNELDLVENLVDDGYSASKGHHLSHGKFGIFMTDVDAGKYRDFALVVEKMDRISRLDIDETLMLTRRLIKGGVELHQALNNRVTRSLDDLPTVILDVVDHSLAQKYTDNLKTNIRGGFNRIQDQAASEGRVMSTRVPMWLEVVGRKTIGVKVLDPGKIVPIPEKVAVVREAYRLAGLGVGVKNIARQLNGSCLSLSWLTRTLSDRAVIGEHTPVGRDPIPHYFPQIVTQTEFDAAREQIARRVRKHEKFKCVGSNRTSHIANNLFSGLLYDVTTKPGCGLNFQKVKNNSYLMSAFRADRKGNRMRYNDFERAFLAFLSDLDWRDVAGQAESDELKAAANALDKVNGELKQTNNLIAAREAAMDKVTDVDASIVLAAQLSKYQAKATALTAEEETLTTKVDSARAKCEALHSPESLLALIRSNTPEANDVRLRLRTEIRRRVSRVDVVFGATVLTAGPVDVQAGEGRTVAKISFINGAAKWIFFEGDRAVLLS